MMGFFDLDTLSTLHLSGWNERLHSSSQSANATRSFCRTSQSWLFLIVLYTIASSAKSLVLDDTHSGRSLINIRNRALSEVAPSTITCCDRSVRKDLIQLKVDPLMP